MERYNNTIMGIAGFALMMMAISAYSFVSSPEYQLYSSYEQHTQMLPQPDDMLLSQK